MASPISKPSAERAQWETAIRPGRQQLRLSLPRRALQDSLRYALAGPAATFRLSWLSMKPLRTNSGAPLRVRSPNRIGVLNNGNLQRTNRTPKGSNVAFSGHSSEEDTDSYTSPVPSYEPAPRPRSKDAKESVLAAGLMIEGKIEGVGHVRVAGRFKGDVNVDGDLTIDAGAKITGSVRASTVTIGGELEGNIEAASRVELLATGVLTGDLKAGSLTVASGSRMRGNVSFGWDEVVAPQPRLRMEHDAAS